MDKLLDQNRTLKNLQEQVMTSFGFIIWRGIDARFVIPIFTV